MINKDKAIKYLNWYFYEDDGMADKDVVQEYENLKEYIGNLEKCYDKVGKVCIYLLRKYEKEFIEQYKYKSNFEEWHDIMLAFDKISEEMNRKMPEPWYTYCFGRKEDV